MRENLTWGVGGVEVMVGIFFLLGHPLPHLICDEDEAINV